MWFIGFGTGLSKARGKPFMQNKKRIEIQTMVDKLNHEGNLMVREAKEKQSEDLKERPLFVLTKGDLVSYVHDPYREPYIQEMVMRYNNKEYTFKISSISIKDKK
jgi:hypothetical protein